MDAVIGKVIAGFLKNGKDLSEVKLLRKSSDIAVLVEFKLFVSLKDSCKIP